MVIAAKRIKEKFKELLLKLDKGEWRGEIRKNWENSDEGIFTSGRTAQDPFS